MTRFQFRLRTLMIAVTVAAILCPFGVKAIREWQARQARLEAIERLRSEGLWIIEPMPRPDLEKHLAEVKARQLALRGGAMNGD
jgi:hypothetical protein